MKYRVTFFYRRRKRSGVVDADSPAMAAINALYYGHVPSGWLPNDMPTIYDPEKYGWPTVDGDAISWGHPDNVQHIKFEVTVLE
jgi:hypothetical protein